MARMEKKAEDSVVWRGTAGGCVPRGISGKQEVIHMKDRSTERPERSREICTQDCTEDLSRK